MEQANQQVESDRATGGPSERLSKRAAIWLAAILAVGLGLRLTYLLMVTSNPHFIWIDPDSYMEDARDLAGHGEGWQWTFDAVKHSVEGRDYALPPLYPVFLSLFALFPSFPFTAQVGQVLLATLAIAMVFELGRQTHSVRAGLVAAAIYALWLPNVIAVWSTMQETLYIPLLLVAFVLLTRAVNREAGWRTFGASGVVFGLAALTRSMPVYFMLPASMLYVAMARDRKIALGGLVVWLGGFALVTVPYSAALSHNLGEPTFIENHGGLRIVSRYGDIPGHRPAGLVDTVGVLARAVLDSPGETLKEWTATAKSIFHVNGGRLLQIYLAAATYAGAVLWKLVVHLGADLLFIVSMILAPLGCVVARRWRISVLFALWIVLNITLTTLSGFGGARLRAPFEPHMIVLAGVILAGQYQRRRSGWLGLSFVVAVVSVLTVLPQVPRSLEARADYGVNWTRPTRPKTTPIEGRVGFNLLPAKGLLSFVVRAPETEVQPADIDMKVRLNGRLADDTQLGGWRRRFIYEWPEPQVVFVELTATRPKGEEPVNLILRLGR